MKFLFIDNVQDIKCLIAFYTARKNAKSLFNGFKTAKMKTGKFKLFSLQGSYIFQKINLCLEEEEANFWQTKKISWTLSKLIVVSQGEKHIL